MSGNRPFDFAIDDDGIGLPIQRVKLHIVDPDGQEVTRGEFSGHPYPPIVQRAQKPPSTSNFARKATITTHASDRGRNTFQPIRMSWS